MRGRTGRDSSWPGRGRSSLTNLDKPFFPEGYTKGDLIQYYASVAPVILPHLAERPISMSRYPDGIGGPSFYEKRAPGHQPALDGDGSGPFRLDGRNADFLLASNRESLMWFANMGCIEFHPFHSRAGALDQPDIAIFDFDPAEGAEWDQVIAGAKLLNVLLEQLGLRGYPKLSGSKGLHVYVPIEPSYAHSRVRRFVEAVGQAAGRGQPGRPDHGVGHSQDAKARSSSITTATPTARPSPRSTRSVPAPVPRFPCRSPGTSSTSIATAISPSPTSGTDSLDSGISSLQWSRAIKRSKRPRMRLAVEDH